MDNTNTSDRRLRLLDRAIEGSPDTAVNYLLRGEYHLQHSRFDAAIEDFRQAIELEQANLAQSEWGYLEQALIDRATRGLQLATTLLF